MSNTQVVKKENTLPVSAAMYEEDANHGFEEATADSYAIPFIAILQSNSPQCDKKDGAYIKGAEQGRLFNTVTEETFDGDEGVQLIPVHYKQSFIEWLPRGAGGGGGFVAEHSVADGNELLKQCTKNDKNQMVLPNGNILVDTRTHYVLRITAEGTERAVISMASTQLKKSKRWMTNMQNIKMTRADGVSQFTPPMFSHCYHATTVPESNDKGSWYGWKIATVGQVEDGNLYNEAKAFRDALMAGEVKVQQPQSDVAGPTDEQEEF